MSRLSGKAGRFLRELTCARVLVELRRERTQYREIQRTNAYENGFYTGYMTGLQHAIDLIETEYR